MGLFNKKNQRQESRSDSEDVDQFKLVMFIIATQNDPVLFLGMLITHLLEAELIAASDLEKIGLTGDELDGLRQSLVESESAEEFDNALSVRAAIRSYDRVIETIATERGILLNSEDHRSLRTVLATFASENNLTDLRVAYRLMLAECPERLPGQ